MSRTPAFAAFASLVFSLGCGSSSGSQPSGAGQPDGSADTGVDGATHDAAPSDGSSTDAAGDAAPDAPCDEQREGVYEVTGSDSRGAYAGTVEVRSDGTNLTFVRTIEYVDYEFEGLRVAQALEGSVESSAEGLEVSFALDQVGYATAYGATTREGMELTEPASFAGTMHGTGCNAWQGTISGTTASGVQAFDEQWTWSEPGGAEPIWRNERTEAPAADPPSSSWLVEIGFDAEAYAADPRIAPYAGRSDFQAGMQLSVFDPTDFDYYRDPSNEGAVRVIQHVVDPVAMAEARQRMRAYSVTLASKELHYGGDGTDAGEVQRLSVNEIGMMARWDDALGRYVHDGDALLWTGVYVAALAHKHLVTGEAHVLEDLAKSLDGAIKCVEITGDPTHFARTLRVALPGDTDPEFVAGVGPYEGIEWKVGGNNDMLKGIYLAFLWGSFALAKADAAHYAQLVQQYGDLRQRMIDALGSLIDHHAELQFGGVADLAQLPNYFQANAILKAMMRVSPHHDDGSITIEEWQWILLKQYWDQESVAFLNEGGVSDWSGNHLGLVNYLNLHASLVAVGDTSRAETIRGYVSDANQQMKSHRLGHFQLVTAVLGNLPDPEGIDDATWRLREIPIPRGGLDVDWRINPGFCMSPLPELIWKNDWQTGDRTQSLRAYPFFEMPASSYLWKDNPYRGYRGRGQDNLSGIDFLFAYWFGRVHGVIPTDG